MARSIKELAEERAGKFGPQLDTEADEARSGAAALSGGGSERAEVVLAVAKMQDMMDAWALREEQFALRMERIAMEMRNALHEAEDVRKNVEDERTIMQAAIEGGLMEAHSVATEHALGEIDKVAAAAQAHIRTLEDESRARTERLRRIVLPDRLFNALKWLLLLMGLVVAAHFVFHVVF